MSIFEVASERVFWDRWEEKFTSNANNYITPYDDKVQDAVISADVCRDCEESEKVDDIWEYVFDEIDYELTKEWKEPRQTLEEGTGDCEDVSFLASSMMMSVGISGFDFVIGELDNTGSEVEKHTWLDVDGRIVDPTSPVGGPNEDDYDYERTFTLVHGGE